MSKPYPTHRPCPFCGSTDLLDGDWYLDDEEVDAIECSQCAAGAPAPVWNRRVMDCVAPFVDFERYVAGYDSEDQCSLGAAPFLTGQGGRSG